MVVVQFIVSQFYAINLPDNQKGKEFLPMNVHLTCSIFSFAYVEFADKDSVQTALALDDSLFKGRQIKVNQRKVDFSSH
jgi:RNA recognition motif-containing protein